MTTVESVPELRLRSQGSDQGDVLTKVYEATVKDMIEKIDDDGFFNVSKADAPLYLEDGLVGK